MNFFNKCPFRKTEMTQNRGTLIQRIGYKSVGLWLKEKKVATLCGNDLQKARGSLYSELGTAALVAVGGHHCRGFGGSRSPALLLTLQEPGSPKFRMPFLPRLLKPPVPVIAAAVHQVRYCFHTRQFESQKAAEAPLLRLLVPKQEEKSSLWSSASAF